MYVCSGPVAGTRACQAFASHQICRVVTSLVLTANIFGLQGLSTIDYKCSPLALAVQYAPDSSHFPQLSLPLSPPCSPHPPPTPTRPPCHTPSPPCCLPLSLSRLRAFPLFIVHLYCTRSITPIQVLGNLCCFFNSSQKVPDTPVEF